MGVLLLADRRLQRHRLLCDFQDVADLVHRHVHLGGDLLRGGVVAQLLQKLAGHADDLVDGLHHVHRDTDGAGLVGDGAGYCLANPPGGVCGKFVALGVVEFVNGLYKAQISLLDKIQKQHAAANIALGYGHHQTEVCLRHAALGLLVAVGHALCQLLLLLRSQQRHLAYLLEIHAHGVVGGEGIRQRVGVGYVLLGDLLDLLQLLKSRQLVVVHRGQVVVRDVNIHSGGFQIFIEFVDDLGIQTQLLQSGQILGGELAHLFAFFDKVVELLLRRFSLAAVSGLLVGNVLLLSGLILGRLFGGGLFCCRLFCRGLLYRGRSRLRRSFRLLLDRGNGCLRALLDGRLLCGGLLRCGFFCRGLLCFGLRFGSLVYDIFVYVFFAHIIHHILFYLSAWRPSAADRSDRGKAPSVLLFYLCSPPAPWRRWKVPPVFAECRPEVRYPPGKGCLPGRPWSRPRLSSAYPA